MAIEVCGGVFALRDQHLRRLLDNIHYVVGLWLN